MQRLIVCCMGKESVIMGDKKLPVYCCIALTESCFMQCKMCLKGRAERNNAQADKAGKDDWQKFITDLAGLCKDRKPRLNFAGGEPLSDPDTLDIITFASSKGFDSLLATNAYLIDTEMAKALARTGLKQITISLDAAKAEKHDFLRGTEGSFKRVLQAIDLLGCYAPDITIDITTTISGYNLK